MRCWARGAVLLAVGMMSLSAAENNSEEGYFYNPYHRVFLDERKGGPSPSVVGSRSRGTKLKLKTESGGTDGRVKTMIQMADDQNMVFDVNGGLSGRNIIYFQKHYGDNQWFSMLPSLYTKGVFLVSYGKCLSVRGDGQDLEKETCSTDQGKAKSPQIFVWLTPAEYERKRRRGGRRGSRDRGRDEGYSEYSDGNVYIEGESDDRRRDRPRGRDEEDQYGSDFCDEGY